MGETMNRVTGGLRRAIANVVAGVKGPVEKFLRAGDPGFLRIAKSARQYHHGARHYGEGIHAMMVRLGAKRPGERP